MRRANKSKHNSIGKLLNISIYTGSRTAPVITAENRMLRRLKGERGRGNKKNERGTVVNCLLDKCDYNQDCICTREEITLSEEHYCVGGCDDGWKIKEEDDED